MDAEQLIEVLEKHEKWLNCEDDGEKVDLRFADLRYADLRGANLRGVNLDFSCWPLWCGSLDVIVDKRIAAQLAYHFCRIICDDEEVKAAQKALATLANQFYLVEECGRVEG